MQQENDHDPIFVDRVSISKFLVGWEAKIHGLNSLWQIVQQYIKRIGKCIFFCLLVIVFLINTSSTNQILQKQYSLDKHRKKMCSTLDTLTVFNLFSCDYLHFNYFIVSCNFFCKFLHYFSILWSAHLFSTQMSCFLLFFLLQAF